MRPLGGPMEEPQVLVPVKGLDPVTGLANEESDASSQSYACLDIISFENFVPPRLKNFDGIHEGRNEQEGDGEGLTVFTELPTPIREEPIPVEKPTKARSKTLRIIDVWGKSSGPRHSKPVTEDTSKGNTSKSDSKDLQLATSSTNREMQQVQGEYSLEGGGRPDLTRSMLYNWHLLRMDNIRILDPLWEGFRGSANDYELLKLLTQTHEHQRWWLILVDDFACPQCVEALRLQRKHPRSLHKAIKSLKSKCTRHAHCGGGLCKVMCTHTHPDCNKVTQFFSKLGRENANRMRNIVFETRDDLLPNADVLVSVAHNVGRYFPDVQNLEINFHFGDRYLDREVWTRIICACVRLEHCLPKGQHLRIRGIEKHTEMQNDWTRKDTHWPFMLLSRAKLLVTPNLTSTARLFSTSPSFTMAQKITNWVDPKDKSGEFKRGASVFRNHISREAGAEFPAEKGRYHLYVSYACPWAHRALIVRKLKGLEDIVPYTAVHWHMGEGGWRFATSEDKDAPGDNVHPDPVKGHEKYTHLRQIYFSVDPNYTGRFTVPTLYDTVQNKIVSNESADIIRMFYTEFDDLLPQKYKDVVLFPENLQAKIEETNGWTYDLINNGVYKSGFATTPEAYEKNVLALFEALDRVEKHLESSPGPFYWGDKVTEGDVRLYTTIVRFDPVYVQHFKTNIRDIRSGYPAIHKWLRNLYWNVPAFGETTQFEHIKRHYTKSHPQINPFGITPVGPLPNILKADEEVRAASK
ncbi:hypothetical protein V494_00990 [Pseudogymnoascus sp. VKM F-4513 (FW-928)]|nr:hypothetical protein V494_00990 [Pseudogymnoascus sp. VKM F-4513 (FW-928)]